MKNKNNNESTYQIKNKIEIYIDFTPSECPLSIVVISFQLEVFHNLNVSYKEESRYLPFLIIIQSLIYKI